MKRRCTACSARAFQPATDASALCATDRAGAHSDDNLTCQVIRIDDVGVAERDPLRFWKGVARLLMLAQALTRWLLLR